MTARGRVLTLAAVTLAVAAPALAAQGTDNPGLRLVRGPEVGQRAPDFTLPSVVPDSMGRPVPFSLWKTRGQAVVLVFVPRARTPSATTALQTIQSQRDSLAPAAVAAISADSASAMARFGERLGVGFPILHDSGQVVAKRYGVNRSDGFSELAVFAIDSAGMVRYRRVGFRADDARVYDDLARALKPKK